MRLGRRRCERGHRGRGEKGKKEPRAVGLADFLPLKL